MSLSSSVLLTALLLFGGTFPGTVAFQHGTPLRRTFPSSSSRRMFSPVTGDLSAVQTLLTSFPTTMATAVEVAGSDVIKQVFEPQISTETGIGFLAITVLITVTGGYWWNIIIPAKRTELALSKSKGDVKEFLGDLREAEKTGDKKLERWMFTDWLNKTPGSKKAGAIPFLKKAKWNSGDNPVLVAFGSIMACVIAASIGERIAGN